MIAKGLLKEALLGQRKRMEEARTAGFVRREKLADVGRFAAGMKHAVVVTGVRRCGKSVLLSEIVNEFFSERYYYVNFEDERLAGFSLEDFGALYETCIELFGEARVFFLDEIQGVTGWERWVRRMQDDGFKFFITGSNARLLSRELGTLLTGRHVQLMLLPFSFREFLAFKGFVLAKNDPFIAERKARLSKLFSEYVANGGFPEFLKSGNAEILQGCFNDILQRDIAERYRVKKFSQLKEIARYAITNSAKLATYNRLSSLTAAKSVNTVISYVEYLENAQLIFRVPLFSHSVRRQSVNPFKIFAIDTGLMNAVGFRFGEDWGRLYETLVAVELKRRGKDIYYWKGDSGKEVDFVVKSTKSIESLIQVCYDVGDRETKDRETLALMEAASMLKCTDLLVLTNDYETEEKTSGKTIVFKPLWKWMLGF